MNQQLTLNYKRQRRNMAKSKFDKLISEVSEPWLWTEQSHSLSLDPVLWTEQARKLKGDVFSFDGRPYLKPVYRNVNLETDVVKGRQTEFSEFIFNRMLFNAWAYPGTTGTYFAPRQGQVKRFREKRVDQWGVNASEVLQKIVDQKNSTQSELKLFNGSSVYFVSAWAGFEEIRNIPNDFLYGDEVQSMNLDEIDVATESMSHSKFKWMWLIGTGAHEGSQWEQRWKKGTQNHWRDNAWISKNPTAKKTSYWVPQHIVPWIGYQAAEDKKSDMTLRRWTTEVLGWWFRGRAKPLLERDIKRCFVNDQYLQTPNDVDVNLGPICVGIDYGGGNHTIITFWQRIDMKHKIDRLIYIERIPDDQPSKQAKKLLSILDQYPWDYGIQDAGGGTEQYIQLEDVYGYKMSGQDYSPSRGQMFDVSKIPTRNKLSVNRTWNIDRVIEAITLPIDMASTHVYRTQLPGGDPISLEWIIEQYTCIEAQNSITGNKGERTIYVKGSVSDRDDVLHCHGNALSAFDLLDGGGGAPAASGVANFGT